MECLDLMGLLQKRLMKDKINIKLSQELLLNRSFRCPIFQSCHLWEYVAVTGEGTTEQSAVVTMAPIGKKSSQIFTFLPAALPLEQNTKSHVWDNNVVYTKIKGMASERLST